MGGNEEQEDGEVLVNLVEQIEKVSPVLKEIEKFCLRLLVRERLNILHRVVPLLLELSGVPLSCFR